MKGVPCFPLQICSFLFSILIYRLRGRGRGGDGVTRYKLQCLWDSAKRGGISVVGELINDEVVNRYMEKLQVGHICGIYQSFTFQ